jgi:hypothetical protein
MYDQNNSCLSYGFKGHNAKTDQSIGSYTMNYSNLQNNVRYGFVGVYEFMGNQINVWASADITCKPFNAYHILHMEWELTTTQGLQRVSVGDVRSSAMYCIIGTGVAFRRVWWKTTFKCRSKFELFCMRISMFYYVLNKCSLVQNAFKYHERVNISNSYTLLLKYFLIFWISYEIYN